jgi:hypothetical protein
LGAHLSLRDPAWAHAMSACCAPLVNLWIVADNADHEALQRLAREVHDGVRGAATQPQQFPPPRVREVLIRDFEARRYQLPPDARPGGGYACALDMLDISHPTHAHVIHNALVDRGSLERVALAATPQAADDAIAAKHAQIVLDRSGRQLRLVGSTQSSQMLIASRIAPRLRVINSAGQEQTQLLEKERRDTERRLQEAARRKTDALRQKREVQEQIEALQEEHRAAREQVAAARRQIRTCVDEIQATQALMEAPDEDDDVDDGDARDGDDDDRGGSDANKRRLVKALNRARERLERMQRDLDAATAAAEDAHAAMDTAVQEHAANGGLEPDELETADAQLAAVGKAREKLREFINKTDARIAELERESDRLLPVVEAAERDLLPPLLAAARRVCDDAQGALDLTKGKEVCLDAARRRLDGDTRKSVQKLTPEQKHERAVRDSDAAFSAEWMCEHLDALDDRLREAEEQAGGSRESVEHELAMVKAEIRRQAGVVRNLSQTNDAVQAQVTRRQQAYDGLFASVEQTVRHKFELFMARRHHNGTIKIDREKGELDILVVPNGARGQGGAGGGGGRGGAAAQHARDLRQLSGGERSFTTVAFMLALGEWTESPFRAADELDVFMDAVNRRVAMEAVLEFAAERDHLQMVLLTPQDLQAVEDAKASLARRRARRARQARRQQQQEEEAEARGGRRGRAGAAAQQPQQQQEEEDDVDDDEAAAAALPEGFVRVLKMPAAREAGGVRAQQRRAAAAGGEEDA